MRPQDFEEFLRAKGESPEQIRAILAVAEHGLEAYTREREEEELRAALRHFTITVHAFWLQLVAPVSSWSWDRAFEVAANLWERGFCVFGPAWPDD